MPSRTVTLVGLVIGSCLLLWLIIPRSTPAPLEQPPVLSLPKPIRRRIVAVGDLHGDLANALRVLKLAGVVDHRANWIGTRNTVLVQTGDIVDRGPDTIALYRLMATLSEAAQKMGTQVVSILGNHEVMNALHDWRYVTAEDIASFGGERARRAAISSEGWIGQLWLDHYNISARVPYLASTYLTSHPSALVAVPDQQQQHVLATSAQRDIPPNLSFAGAAFVHGGIHPRWTEERPEDPIGYINEVGHSLLRRALVGPIKASIGLPPGTTHEEADLYSEGGPLWYRGYALDVDEDAVCERAKRTMDALKVRRLVMGHTPSFEGMRTRCDGRVIIIDTGISRAYGGVLSALEIAYSLHPRPLSSPDDKTRIWIEKEVVTVLEEGVPNRLVAKDEDLLELPVAVFG